MQFRIASYNIRKAIGLDGYRDPARVLAVVNQLDADLVALQEADLRHGQRPTALPREMIEGETDFVIADVATNDVSIGWHGNAFLLRRELAVLHVWRLRLPGLEPRGAVMLRVGRNGAEINVVGAHLGLLRRWRRQQLRTICRHVGEEAPHTVMVGDFNEWSHTRGMEPLQGRFSVLAPGRTFHTARPVAALDRIAYGRHLSVREAGVDDTGRARMASDHLPIWADLVMAPAPIPGAMPSAAATGQ